MVLESLLPVVVIAPVDMLTASIPSTPPGFSQTAISQAHIVPVGPQMN